jgi:polysaccharide biosynthesis/export protein
MTRANVTRRLATFFGWLGLAWTVSGCATQGWVPTSGPTRDAVVRPDTPERAGAVQVVPLSPAVAQRLSAARRTPPFTEALPAATLPSGGRRVGPGDVIEVSIFEAPPALLFGAPSADPRQGASRAASVVLPELHIDREGTVNIPFAGSVPVTGLTTAQVETEIAARLRGKANQPQVLVRMLRVTSSSVTVVGEVASSVRMPLAPGFERVLDALTAAGGVRQPVGKVTLQLTRGGAVASMPLESVIRDPRQNVPLQAGDVLTALFQPLSFTVLGATGRNEEVSFESTGITLAQALARAGGLVDARADARGVFIFRMEDPQAVDWPQAPMRLPDGRVPVVYMLDMNDPAGFFIAQSFPISNQDLLYVSNAPGAELQKFLNLLWGAALPALNVLNLTR